MTTAERLKKCWHSFCKRYNEGFCFEFHNRHPSIIPTSFMLSLTHFWSDVQSKRTEVWLKVSISGAQPNSFYQGISENRKSFVLDGYKGDLGIQCLSGVGVKVRK